MVRVPLPLDRARHRSDCPLQHLVLDPQLHSLLLHAGPRRTERIDLQKTDRVHPIRSALAILLQVLHERTSRRAALETVERKQACSSAVFQGFFCVILPVHDDY